MAKLPHRKSTSKATHSTTTRLSRPLPPSNPLTTTTTTRHAPSQSKPTSQSHPRTLISGGITKPKWSKMKPLSRSQRLRKERGVEKAERVVDRTSQKVEKSVGRLGKRKGRRREWEDVNADAVGKRRKGLIGLASGEGVVGMEEGVLRADGGGEVGREDGKMEEDSSAGEGDDFNQAIRAAPVQKGLLSSGKGMAEPGGTGEVLEEEL